MVIKIILVVLIWCVVLTAFMVGRSGMRTQQTKQMKVEPDRKTQELFLPGPCRKRRLKRRRRPKGQTGRKHPKEKRRNKGGN